MTTTEGITGVVSKEQEENIRALMGKFTTEVDLFAEIGRSLGPAATGEPPEQRGRWAIQQWMEELRAIACRSSYLRKFCDDPNTGDATNVAIAVTGALIAANFAGINPILVGCLLARIGLRSICAQEWTNPK